ncbi:MAG: nuclear transport factor 2 family protein [Deltaproteobacteria bacterium]|nr:nuclear transport factor 2 family protein [Deltaproteobacteria bacterium]
MIEKTIEVWHRIVRGELPGGLDELLADDCVFHSPIVFTPQKGKAITRLYLEAAGATFRGEGDGRGLEGGVPEAKLRYVKEVLSGRHAVLEFEATVDGKTVNGVDMITCDDAGRIVEFKVMVRPLQAVNLMHQKMAAMLEQLKPR